MPYNDRDRQLAAQSKHYQDNKDDYRSRQSTRRAALREIVRAAKNVPCADCGIQYHYCVMQFDHTGEDKIDNVARMVANLRSIALILAEIAKCEVVCSNCHALRTFQRSTADSAGLS